MVPPRDLACKIKKLVSKQKFSCLVIFSSKWETGLLERDLKVNTAHLKCELVIALYKAETSEEYQGLIQLRPNRSQNL